MHERVVDGAGCKGSCFRLRRWRRKGLGQTAVEEESRAGAVLASKGRTPKRLWREGACRDGIQLALELRRQGDRREVLELHTVSYTKSAADGGSPAARRIVGKAYARGDVVLVRRRIAEVDDAWNTRYGIQSLSARTHWVGPVLVAKTEVQGKLRCHPIVILAEEV